MPGRRIDVFPARPGIRDLTKTRQSMGLGPSGQEVRLWGMDQASVIPVICLDGQNEIWEFARRTLEGDGHIRLIRSPAMLREIAVVVNRTGPAVLLSDDAFLGKLSKSGVRRLSAFPGLRVLTVIQSRNGYDSALAHLREGCSGILHLDDPIDLSRKAIWRVAAGELWVPRKVLARFVREMIQLDRVRSDKLTPRESEILEMIGLGCDNEQIATQLFISKETVRWHVRGLYAKIGASDREGAAQFWRLHR